MAGIGSIVFEGGSSSIGFLVDSYGDVASFSAWEQAASTLLSRVWRRLFLADLEGADSVAVLNGVVPIVIFGNIFEGGRFTLCALEG